MPLQPNFHGSGRREWRGRMHHSHRHSRQQMKQRPQNVHKRHGCVTSTKHVAFRKFRDMHICSLEFKTMPWHAWEQNKIERYKIEQYNDSRSIFLSTAHAFQCKDHIFFCAINHIDPLHRQQTLTLSQCNSRDLTDTFTHKSFYTQTVLHTDASTRRHFYTQMRFTHAHTLSHTEAFTHRNFYTQTLLHTDPFTHRRFYTQHFHTQMLLHTEAFTHRGFYTQKLLHTEAFTHRSFYTQALLHTDTFTHRRFYTQTLLHTDAFTHRHFYTQTLLHTDAFTHRRFYTQTLLHT